MANGRAVRKKKPEAIPEEINLFHTYKCEDCKKVFQAVDLNDGLTDFYELCFATYGCQGRAVSQLNHSSRMNPNIPVLIEFYAPAHVRGLSYELQAHVKKGGLIRRASKNAPEWVKRLA